KSPVERPEIKIPSVMPAFSFRNRILLALLLLGALPTSVILVGWAYTLLRNNPAKASQAALQPVRTSGRKLLEVLDTAALSPVEREALRTHRDVLNLALARSQRAVAFNRYRTYALAIVVLVLGAGLLYLSVVLGRSLARQLS